MVIENYESLWTGHQLLVDKPKEWTSFDVVNKIRFALKFPGKKIKVGHAGTLDPLATGLLVICTGKNTKTISELQGLDKVYTGRIRLGATTPSYDAETAVDQEFDISGIYEADIRSCADSFIGEYDQIPPVHSAIKVDGTRAYKMARAGKTIEMRSRRVRIDRFELTEIELPNIDFVVECSKGTYIRSLAYDLGRRLDNGAYLASLCRTAIGPHLLKNAWKLDDLINFIDAHKDQYIENFRKQE